MKLSKILTSKKEGSNQSSKSKLKDKKGKSKKPKITNKHKWKTVPLKDSDPTKIIKGHSYDFKTVENKEYYWCKYHSAFVRHEPEGDGKEGCHPCKQQDTDDTPCTRCNNNSFVNVLTSILEEIEKD